MFKQIFIIHVIWANEMKTIGNKLCDDINALMCNLFT